MSMMGGPSHWGAMELWTFWAAILGMVGFMQNLLPKEYANIFHTWVRKLVNYFIPYVLFDIPEFYGAGSNEIYDYVQSYLSSTSAERAQHVSLCRPKNATQNIFSLAHNETIEEAFLGAKLWWTHEVSSRQPGAGGGMNWRGMVSNDEKRKYTLKIRKADKARMLESYVQHVMDVAKNLRENSRDRLLYTNLRDRQAQLQCKGWESVPFKHPSTFETLAMDPELKEEVKNDLLEFTKGKEYYQKAGKAWKRGYLLYGPPGTGKSSMIAAIANFLNYDVYDVELTEVSSNSALRKLLINTTNRSVIVIEDIDCSVDLAERAKAKAAAGMEDPNDPDSASGSGSRGRVTLSGLLNFTDGLWSCCGSERIIIFTTNYIEKLDKALLRAGRMDKHIHMSWCRYPAFVTLARNNLNLDTHELFPAIKNAIADKAISPADVSELLLKKKRNPTAALKGLLEVLKSAPTAAPDTTKGMLDEDLDDDDDRVEDEQPFETNLPDFPQDQISSDDSRPESPHADSDNSPPNLKVNNVGTSDPTIIQPDSPALNSTPPKAIAA